MLSLVPWIGSTAVERQGVLWFSMAFICFRRSRTCFFITPLFLRPFSHSTQWQFKNGQWRLWPFSIDRIPWLLQIVQERSAFFLVCFSSSLEAWSISLFQSVEKRSQTEISFFVDDALTASTIDRIVERNLFIRWPLYSVTDKQMSVKSKSRSWLAKVSKVSRAQIETGQIDVHSKQNKCQLFWMNEWINECTYSFCNFSFIRTIMSYFLCRSIESSDEVVPYSTYSE